MQDKTKPVPIKYISVPVPKRSECCELKLPSATRDRLAVSKRTGKSEPAHDLVGLAG